VPEVECLVLEAFWSEILKSIKCSNQDDISVYSRVSNLKKIPIFSMLTDLKLFMLSKSIQIKSYKPNTLIINEGTYGCELFIIQEGKVSVYKKNCFIRVLDTNSFFGDLSHGPSCIWENTVVSEDYLECYVIHKKSFQEIVDPNFHQYLQNLIILQDSSVNLEDLFYIKSLGNGKFGKVYLVHNKKNFYALKTAEIKNISKQNQLMKYYLNEKNIMLHIDSPFIVKLVKTMKNREMIFFLLEYIDGVTLKHYLNKRTKSNLKNIYETQFLGAIFLHTINYLHKNRIIHRDIKPDNCMIDKNVPNKIKLFFLILY